MATGKSTDARPKITISDMTVGEARVRPFYLAWRLRRDPETSIDLASVWPAPHAPRTFAALADAVEAGAVVTPEVMKVIEETELLLQQAQYEAWRRRPADQCL